MLDGRVYRTAFIPALVALCVAAFALEDRPPAARSSLSADAFSGERALGNPEAPEKRSLLGMAAAFPDRTPGGAGDTGLADLVARTLAAPEERGARPAFKVERTTTTTAGGDVETVIATRIGPSNRRIVVLADRDGRGLADLSGTAALLELGRVFKSRELRKTLVLVSTSGALSGFEGARAWARSEAGGPVDGVIVLGDVAGTKVRKPWVVGWSSSSRPLPLGLERTVQAAVKRETRSDAGGPHAVGQWVRRAIPVAVSEQAPIGGEGLPAVLLSVAGERGPAANDPVLPERMQGFGRAAVRAVGAIDAAGREDAPAFADAPSGLVTMRNVLPEWAVRLLVGSALLPALVAGLDAFFRARRRRAPITPWVLWLAVAAVPLPVAWLWLRALGATGIVDAPDGPVLPDRFPLGTEGIVALVSAAIAAALATWLARTLAAGRRRVEPRGESNGRRPAPGLEGLAVATGAWLCGLAALAWLVNPYAAGLLVVAVHLWLLAAAAWRGRAALAALVAGLLAPALAFMHLGFALGLGPIGLAWGAALGAASGAGFGSALLLAGLFAGFAGTARAALARGRIARQSGGDAAPILTRGPVSYAGPGSLGGTESALRR
ncbi:MAG TPA: hypothetical protein VFG79_14825 [Solirubrobacter sp.]|nr:hypothetical protein [Solirubrobacter sp.]